MGKWERPEIGTDGMLWSDTTGPWVWMRFPAFHWDGVTDTERVAELRRLTAAIEAIEVGEAVLIVTSFPASIDRIPAGSENPIWLADRARTLDAIRAARYEDRVAFLGVRLNSQSIGTVGHAVRSIARTFGVTSDRSDAPSDRNVWRRRASLVVTSVTAAGMPVLPATVEDLERLVARPAWMGLDRGARVSAGSANGHQKWGVRIEYPDGRVQWVATLVASVGTRFGTFPDDAWLLPRNDLGNDQPDVIVRFDVVSHVEQADALQKARQVLADQIDNAGVDDVVDEARAGRDAHEKLADAHEMERVVRRTRKPWVWPSIHVVVSAGEPAPLAEVGPRALLEDTVKRVTASFERDGVRLVWPERDQWALLAEQVPGARWRVRDWARRMPAETLAAAMPHARIDVGMDRGVFIGTTRYIARSPVFLDPVGLAALNLPTTMAATGRPGSGKSALSKKLYHAARLMGAQVVSLNPSRENSRLLAMPGFEDAEILELDASHVGRLDPWAICRDVDDAKLLALDLVRTMLPPMGWSNVENELTAAADEVAHDPDPSMALLVERLIQSHDPATVAAGRALKSHGRTGLARLLFGEPGVRPAPLVFADSFTDLRWRGLVPPDAGSDPASWTPTHRLSLAVLTATAALLARLMETLGGKGRPVLVNVAEAHLLTPSDAGRRTLVHLAKMGRKFGVHLFLDTQEVGALGDDSMLSNIAVAFAFKAIDPREQAAAARLLGRASWAPNETGTGGSWIPDPDIVARLGHLPQGTCLMRDHLDRVTTVRVEFTDPDLLAAIQTTPMGAPVDAAIGG